MSSRRGTSRRKKKSISSTDKWKGKVWTEIKAPLYIDDKVIGETPATSEEFIIGRTVITDLMFFSNKFEHATKLLKFKIKEIKGNVAHTDLFQYELSRDFMRSQVRNHRSRIDGIYNINFKDGSKVRITIFCITPQRIRTSEKKDLRKIMSELLLKSLNDLTFSAFTTKLLNDEFISEVLEELQNHYDIKMLEVSKVKVLRTPDIGSTEIEVSAS